MKLLRALRREPLAAPPVWFMRQAGRYLPEYRQLRRAHEFHEAVSTPSVAAEITLQPVRRFGVDAAIVFADIMTPLQAMGIEVEFAPGPRLAPRSVAEVAAIPDISVDRVGYVAETIEKVKGELPEGTAMIGFGGAPATLLAYLLEGGGSKDFMALRRAARADPSGTNAALAALGRSMHSYLAMQIEAGADAVQLFDSWVGVFDVQRFATLAAPAARLALTGLEAPTVYFAPHAPHLLRHLDEVSATAYGVDWRMPLDQAWEQIGFDKPIQGNLDPAVLLSPDPAVVLSAVRDVLTLAGGRPGHVFNLGHGIHRTTPVENVATMIAAVRGE